ncbi:hypothetical protein ZYGR_0AI03700, partial [Zygosaccharomyces rouxii]
LLTITETASWLTQLISTDSLKENGFESINDKLHVFFPVAVDYNNSLKTHKLSLPFPDKVQRLESAASGLWNAIAIAIKIEKNEALNQMLCYSRLFACVLLAIHETLIPSTDRKLRVAQCYISTLKVVIDHGWDKLHKLINAHLKDNLSSLEEAASLFNGNEKTQFERLKLEFHVVNFQDALGQGNIELARQFEIQANIIGNVAILDSTLLLDLCRMLYNAILILREKAIGDINSINYFLQKVCDYLELEVPSLKTHVDYSNLRYSILLLLANSQVDQQIEAWDESKCSSILKVLESEYPKKLEPYSLEIDFCKKIGGSSVSQEIKKIIVRMITSVDNLLNFDAIMGIINEFADLNTRVALECLDYFFISKWDPEKDHKWLEKLFIFRFFLTTQSKHLNNTEIIQDLEEYCSQAERRLMDILSKQAMSSVITLLWNSGKKSEKSGKYSESIGFYRIALKSFISQAYADRGKIQRALMSAYIQIAEFKQCEELYKKMTTADSHSPLTQLLLLKIFISQSDEKSCLECLERIKVSEHDNAMDTLILAVSECRASKQLAIKAIPVLFEAIESHQAPEQKLVQWSIPTLCLLRYTSQLILKFVEDEQQEIFTHYLPTLHNLLQKALEYLNRIKTMKKFHETIDPIPQYQEGTSVDEIEWFASTSYNLALKCIAENMDDMNSLDFAQLSRKFIQLIPHKEFTFPKMFHYTYWDFRSHLLCLTIIQTMKYRGNPKALPQVQAESLTLMNDIWQRRNQQNFRDGSSTYEKKKLDGCLSDALLLAFEASLQMQDQVKISEILITTAQWQNPQIENLLADAAISMYELPRGLFMETIEPLIQRNVNNHVIDNFKICQWLRNFLDCALTLGKTSQLDLTEHLLKRIRESPANPDASSTDQLKQEIEMIATLSWNQGVNSIIKGEKTLGMAWCRTSIQFANLYSDHLKKQLQELWNSLASSVELTYDSPTD